MNKYYYNDGFREFGPFTAQELVSKKIRPDYKLKLEGTEEWLLAKDVEEVADLYRAQNTQSSSTSTTQNYSMSQPQQVYERDPSFEKASISGNAYATQAAATTPTSWRQKLLFAILCFWLFDSLITWSLEPLIDQIGYPTFSYITGFFNLIFALVPVAIAITIKNNTLKIIAIIIAALISLGTLINIVRWLINVGSFY